MLYSYKILESTKIEAFSNNGGLPKDHSCVEQQIVGTCYSAPREFEENE